LTPNVESVDASWQDNSVAESGFELYRALTGPDGTFTLAGNTAANVLAWSDLGLSPSTEYCYKVRAFVLAGGTASYSAFSDPVCAITLAPPPPPPDPIPPPADPLPPPPPPPDPLPPAAPAL
jgi:titin